MDKKSWFRIDMSTIITLLSWLVMGAFYVGVHKIELDNLGKQIGQVQVTQKVNQEQLGTISTKVSLLEQSNNENDKKIQELSKTAAQITSITVILDNVKDTQKEMKEDLRDVKRLIEQKLTARSQ